MEINIAIEGRTPLMCNRFTDERAGDSSDGVRGSSAAADRGERHSILHIASFISLTIEQ